MELGSEHQKVLALKGYRGHLYNTGGSSRDHVTLSVTVRADGSVAGMGVVYTEMEQGRERTSRDSPN